MGAALLFASSSLRIILIRRKLIPCLSFVVCFAAPLAGQATDSLSAARRVVAAVSLAAKEYRIGVPGAAGRGAGAGEKGEGRPVLLAGPLPRPGPPAPRPPPARF